ncbi:MAG: ATP-binding protein [Euryarchaeota archaeon]|nr:ATP-binding protein [Euryarchaeota archaeon]
MFVNRANELEAINKIIESDMAEFTIIYGRRRVGKTELLKQILDHDAIYFLGRLESPSDQLRRLSQLVAEKLKDEKVGKFPFRNWDEALHYFYEHPTIVIFDEFPYMVLTEPKLLSVLQDYWDNYLKKTKVKVFLCGSSIAMVEKQLFNYSSPLYGRRTKQLKIEPFKFKDIVEFFPDRKIEELIEIFAVLGGTPAYLLEFDGDIFRTIENKLLRKEEFLYKDAEFVLRDELKEPRYYFSIIKSVALGNTSVGGIMNDTGLGKDVVSKYLSVLCDLDIVVRKVPVTEDIKSRKGIYKIKDNFFNFYFRFVYPNLEYVEIGETGYLIQRVKEGFSKYLGSVFEDICIELLIEMNKKDGLPFGFTKIGGWWHKGEEIDIVAINESTKEVLFAEAKYKSKKVGIKTLENLRERSAKVKWFNKERKEHFMLISRAGFENALRKEGALLLTLDDLA